MKKKEVILVYRKQFAHTYSIEFIFNNLLAYSNNLVKLKKHVLPKFSNSVINRLLNLVSILFLPGKIIHVTGDVHYAILGAWFKIRILTFMIWLLCTKIKVLKEAF